MTLAPLSDPLLPEIYRAVRVERELHDTVTIELQPVSGKRPDFEPGQFNMLYAFGVGEAAISISGDPALDGTFVHTIREVGAVSKALAGLEVGALVGLRGPFGNGWPVAAAEGCDVVMVAGGLGLAPLRPAIYHIMANRGQYGSVIILFGSRNPGDILYPDELELWGRRSDVDVAVSNVRRNLSRFIEGQPLDTNVTVTVDHADANWRGEVGGVPSFVRRAAFDPAETIAMVCGPEIMMKFAVNSLRAAGVDDGQIFLSVERNMKCAVGLCGHCQFGPEFSCKDGPVVPYSKVARIYSVREI